MAFFVFSRLRFPNVRTVVEETWQALARQHSKQVATHLYGQEINAATYAIATANSLLKGGRRGRGQSSSPMPLLIKPK